MLLTWLLHDGMAAAFAIVALTGVAVGYVLGCRETRRRVERWIARRAEVVYAASKTAASGDADAVAAMIELPGVLSMRERFRNTFFA